MKNLLISPKLILDNHGALGFYIDANLVKYFKALNFNLIFISNISQLNQTKIDGVILSGGNDLYFLKKKNINKLRDQFENRLLRYALKKKIKVLGICRGFQFINNYFGGKIRKTKYKKKNHEIYFIDSSYKFKLSNLHKINVNSFHNYCIENTSDQFCDLALDENEMIEISIHRNKRILCTMFHPERPNKDQKEINKLIKNFFI